MQADYLFVYGTLRRQGGSPWHAYLAQHCQYAGEASFQGRLYQLQGYPGLVTSSDARDQVKGELYRLPLSETEQSLGEHSAEKVLRTLDEYEECTERFPTPHEYLRQIHTVTCAHQVKVRAWVYIYNRDIEESARIESGDYFDRRSC